MHLPTPLLLLLAAWIALLLAPQTLALHNNSPKDAAYKFKHYFFIMEENRSMEHLLMDVLRQRGQHDFDNYTNPIPEYVRQATGTQKTELGVWMTDDDLQIPDYSHSYPHMNTQIYGTVSPESNRFVWETEMQMPYNYVEGSKCTQQGYVQDFFNYFGHSKQSFPPESQWHKALTGVKADAIPVLRDMANNFGMSKKWFCEVPSKTFPNRAFSIGGHSHGWVMNTPNERWATTRLRTIFEVLEQRNVTWKVYFPVDQLVSATYAFDASELYPYLFHFQTVDQLYRDLESGDLPQFAFIEPQLLFDTADYHPGHQTNGVSALRRGETFLAQVYNHIRESPWRDDIFLNIVFDETGGCWSAICPPKASPPFRDQKPGEMGFRFDRLGGRVPALYISSYISAKREIDDVLQHTSMMATLRSWLGFSETLTLRDAEAKPIPTTLFDLDEPRPKESWPIIHALPSEPKKKLSRPEQRKQWQQQTLNDEQVAVLQSIQRAIQQIPQLRRHSQTQDLLKSLRQQDPDKLSVLDLVEALAVFREASYANHPTAKQE